MSRNQEQDRFARVFRDYLLQDIPDVKDGGHVPKRLIQFWDKEPPEDVGRMLALSKAWADKHQIDYILYDEEGARRYLADRDIDGKPLLDLFDRCFHPAMKADLFRLVYLQEFGGYYLDADNGATDGALPLFDLDRDIFFLDYGQRRVQNNFMAVAPGSKLIGNVLSAAAINILEHASEDVGIGTLTGPYVFTTELAKLLQQGSYSCYLVDYLGNLKIAPGPEAVLGQNLSYKKSDQNWQRAQAGPIAARLRKNLTTGEPTIADYRELCRVSLKFGIELNAVEEIAAMHWEKWRRHSACIELRSRVLIRLGRLVEASDLLTEAYDRYMRSPWLLKALSGLNMKPGRLEFAETLARQAVEKAPEDPDVHAQLAAVLKARQHLAEAKAVANLARQQFPDSARLKKLSADLETAGSLEAEIADMIEHLAAPQTTGRDRFLSLSQTCLQYGLQLEAVERLAAAWWHDWQALPRCVWMRARVLEALSREREARDVLEAAYNDNCRAPNVLIMLARLMLEAGEPSLAHGVVSQAVAKVPGRVDAKILEMQVLDALDDNAGAQAVWQHLQSHHSQHPLVAALGSRDNTDLRQP